MVQVLQSILRAKIRHEYNFIRPYARTNKDVMEHLRKYFYPMSSQKMKNICCGYGIGAGNKEQRAYKKKQYDLEYKKDDCILEFYYAFIDMLGELLKLEKRM